MASWSRPLGRTAVVSSLELREFRLFGANVEFGCKVHWVVSMDTCKGPWILARGPSSDL